MVEVRHNDGQHRYEAWVDGDRAGLAEYRVTDAVITFVHTEVDDAFEGQGVGSALVRSALDDVRADGTRRVVPLCPFVRGWIAHHPEYADLVDGPATAPTAGTSS